MNLFPLDIDLQKCAEYTVDKHLGKIFLEDTQLLSNCLPESIAPYKRAHYNHPMAKWVRESSQNFDWAIEYAMALHTEYNFRSGKIHKSLIALNKIIEHKDLIIFPKTSATEMPRCFGSFKGIIPETNDVIKDYRQYYILAKQHLFSWKKRNVPSWILED
jgi:hypothetical protein